METSTLQIKPISLIFKQRRVKYPPPKKTNNYAQPNHNNFIFN